jgi:hypothetical protein
MKVREDRNLMESNARIHWGVIRLMGMDFHPDMDLSLLPLRGLRGGRVIIGDLRILVRRLRGRLRRGLGRRGIWMGGLLGIFLLRAGWMFVSVWNGSRGGRRGIRWGIDCLCRLFGMREVRIGIWRGLAVIGRV